MRAVEAAQWVKKNPHCTTAEIEEMIPEYANPLPRRAWLRTFRDNLPSDLKEKFSDLK